MSSSSEKLNVVYVFCDQLSATAVSYAGNPDVHTPNIDRLAAEGVRFDRGYCTFPLCTPARASMFSGRNPHEVGVPFNGHGIDERYREQELGNLVRAAGYECGYGGKWHVREIAMPVDNDHGFEVYSGWDDSNLAGRCVDYMREHRDGPFFVVASFDNPHNVCEMAREQILPWGPVPEVPRIEDCPPLPPNWPVDPYEPGAMQSFRAWFRRHHALGESYTADQWRRYRYLYYRIVERADREVGRILEGIDELGLADSTLVIFSSDHGDMAGAHGFTQKTVLYDDAVRVPFIFRGPGVEKGKVVPGALASNGLDLLPTICDYAGAPVSEDLEGRSLRPFLEGRDPETWRDYLVLETRFHCGDDVDFHGRSVVSEGYTYSVYNAGVHREQLFDLARDPFECVNLARCSRAEGALRQHREWLRDWCERTDDRVIGRHSTHPEVSFLVPGDQYPGVN